MEEEEEPTEVHRITYPTFAGEESLDRLVSHDTPRRVTRASVYLGKDECPIKKLEDCTRQLLESMESDNSKHTMFQTSFVPSNPQTKLCLGPELVWDTPQPETDLLSDIEKQFQELLFLNREVEAPPIADSTDTLDVEVKLAEMVDSLAKNLPNNSILRQNSKEKGSEVNLGFTETENDAGCSSSLEGLPSQNYWKSQRSRPKSMIDKQKLNKFIRNSRNRLSLMELRRSYHSLEDEVEPTKLEKRDSELDLCFEPREPRFIRSAYDRSTLVEPKISSNVSLPTRPLSAMGQVWENSSMGHASSKTSGDYDEHIDWSWLQDFEKEFHEAVTPAERPPIRLRVDAECQTLPEECTTRWLDNGRVRMRETSSCISEPPATSSTYRPFELTFLDCHEEMSDKDEVSGPSGTRVSTWLRQSMRRVRHFNLSEQTNRVRSAPPDALRASGSRENIIDSEVREVPPVTIRTHSEVQVRRPRSACTRQYLVRRNESRSRPNSAPVRRVTNPPSPPPTPPQATVDSSSTETEEDVNYESDSRDRITPPRQRSQTGSEGDEECRTNLGLWPHSLSSVLAGLGCTLGLFNISRFAVLSVQYGSNFIIQFVILSLVIGVPLLAFHAAVGQTLAAGPVGIWKISPLFQGIGIALLLAQALIGIYSVVGVSWMFVYFRDSFITKQDRYRWAEPYRLFREDSRSLLLGLNASSKIEETVPDYLNGVVLQRHGLATPESTFGNLKFQLTFNLAVIWMIVFVSLSKGLRSYGKVIYVFSLVPVVGMLVLCAKLLGLTPMRHGLFPETEWSEFFLNTKTWISAATEVVLTWVLLGASYMQVASHNRSSVRVWRDVVAIFIITMTVLILAAFLANTCQQLLYIRGYKYIPSSFEEMKFYTFLRPLSSSLPPSYATTPVKWMGHSSLVAGERVVKPGSTFYESGYQVIRLSTELVPATLALLGAEILSPFWAVLFYFIMILFGIAQQLAIWHCVITGIMAVNVTSLKAWETTITFFACAAGFVLGLPMATELGVFVVYFLDYCIGGGWWIVLITLAQLCAILMIRGRPYSGEQLSIALFGKSVDCISVWAIPVLVFTWNVLIPVALLIICITVFKNGEYRDLWSWRYSGHEYWPLWARELGVLLQLIPLLCIPFAAIIQSYRYLSTGPPDIFDRIANLYRPSPDTENPPTVPSTQQPTTPQTTATTNDVQPAEDPPPKYTPPPSYSTATGSRIAKMLRQSIRRSVRRIQAVIGAEPPVRQPPPPDYAAVLVEINQSQEDTPTEINTISRNTVSAAEVAQILRSSFRRIVRASETNTLPRSSERPFSSCIVRTHTLPSTISNNELSVSPSTSTSSCDTTPCNSLVMPSHSSA